MIPIALVFPGQGAQKVGMGKEFYDTSPEAKAVFDKADTIIEGLTDVIFNGPSVKLTSTAYCQPGIFVFSMAALEALRAHPKFQNISTRFAAGLSLGEYSALSAAGAFSFEDTLKLVERRSFFMEEACQAQKGAMAAIIGCDQDKLQKVCEETGAQVANYNSPQQIVITGHADKVDAAIEKIREIGAKSIIPLEVGGAFHSALMKTAADQFTEALKLVSINPLKIGVVSNVDGRDTHDTAAILQKLTKQITSPVQWVGTIEYMVSKGVKDFIEIGPGKVLSGLIKRIDRSLNVHNIEAPPDIEKLPF